MSKSHPMFGRYARDGFTLIEVMVVISIIAVLGAMLSPVLVHAQVRGKVAHVHVELQCIQRALEMYRDDWGDYPLAVVYNDESQQNDYLELPPCLYKLHYIGAYRIYDAFNPGHTYKYIAPGAALNDGDIINVGMWVPTFCGQGVVYNARSDCPFKWAIWSVGPGGNIDLFEHESRHLPIPKEEWFPYKENGIIVRLSDGRISP